MKIPKMLKKVEAFLDADISQQGEQKDSIKVILKNLKKKQLKLKEKLAHEKDKEASTKIHKELDIIFVQRKKGLKALKNLKSA